MNVSMTSTESWLSCLSGQTAGKYSSDVANEHGTPVPSDCDVQDGSFEMRMIMQLMIEDSAYLDQCAVQRRAAWKASMSARARFVEVLQEGSESGSESGSSNSGAMVGESPMRLPGHADPCLHRVKLPWAMQAVKQEDGLLFNEFVGCHGEGVATAHTYSLLFRSCH
jgi:hypothetical protein